MTDREPEVRHSTLNDEYESEDPHGDTQRRRFSPETPTTTRIESSTEITILATTMQMMVQLLERQMGAPANSVNGANENATIQITTMPDLAATLPTFSESVNTRRQKDDENITDYMYSRLQRIRRGKYALSDDDIVDWLIQGVRSENAKPMLAAFHDLRKGSVSDFISYARQFDRRTTSTRGEITSVKPSPRDSSARIETANSTAKDDHQPSKPTRISADTCARCLQRGHRAKDCTKPDTRTEEAAAAKRREERAAREQGTHRITCYKTATDYDEPHEQFQLQLSEQFPHEQFQLSDTRHKLQLNEDEQMPPRTADDQPRHKKPPRWLDDYVTDISDYCEDATD
ncbi:hypothetical protein HPB50_011724 [Hyalomma asiaticum]|uniref:Uncharacterized protein n=1 Tax=Hyalomma asiaticum TaxID=266040 RepID=A0ACB7SGZ3_HYAAI|nr:hypothetical protein HPB50_011724 [Hyalomma asiaticum]